MNALQQREKNAGIVELRIPRRAEWVAVARLAVAAVANRLSFSIEEIEDVKIAVAEACTSCILQHEGGDQIDILFTTDQDALTVRVRSFGKAEAAADAAATSVDAELQIGALGILLIRSLMDSVEYEGGSGRDIHLVMTKKVAT